MRFARLFLALLSLPALPAHATPEPPTGRSGLPTPRFASLRAGDANARSGPGEQYPVTFHYARKGLPVKVVREWGPWRLIRDPDGDSGWMDQAMVAKDRTAYVTRVIRTLYAQPDVAAKPLWRAEAGVVARIIFCAGSWCRISIDGQSGYIPRAQLWGVGADEKLG
jgi:SH3-like domain-containing protein